MEQEAKELQMFINKVNIRGGWIDYIDAFRLINIYTNNYGVLSTTLSVEDELLIMWDKINNIKIEGGKIIRKSIKIKKCFVCKLRLSSDDFSRDKSNEDGLDYKCRNCKAIYQSKYNIKKRKK